MRFFLNLQRYWDQKPAASGYYPAAVAVGFNSGGGGGGEIGFYGGGGDRGKHIDYRQGGFNKVQYIYPISIKG